jgi:ArsR family transcriptional regulator
VCLIVDMVEHDRGDYRQSMGHRWLGFSDAQLKGWAAQAGLVTPHVTHVQTDVDAKGPGLFAFTASRPHTGVSGQGTKAPRV